MKLALLAPLILLLLAFTTRAQSTPAVLSAKHLSKAESLVIQLERFDTFANDHPDILEYKARLERLSASVGSVIATIPESDIKTDLATSVHYYELAARAANRFEASKTGSLACVNQRPGIYQRLCAQALGSRRDFLLHKARLHLSWAQAGVTIRRGGTVDVTTLREMEEQRKSDQELAKQALAALKHLESEVVIYSSLGDFEAEPKLARVPCETFQQHLRETVIEVGRILSWLPRNRLRGEISNALSSYQDGAFWWERVHQPSVISVANLEVESRRAQVDTAYLETVPYTIVINWRNASRSLKRAEALLP